MMQLTGQANKMKTDELIRRVTLMEDRFQEVTRVLAALEEAVAEYEEFRSELDALAGYLDSGQWRKDWEADEAGRIPPEIARGVLSEDGLYNLLQDADHIIAHTRKVFRADVSDGPEHQD